MRRLLILLSILLFGCYGVKEKKIAKERRMKLIERAKQSADRPPPQSMSECGFTMFDVSPRPVANNSINDFIVYPKEAKNKRIEGKVLIKFYVDKNGVVDLDTFEIIKGVPGLNQASIDALKKSKWQPAMLHDIRVGTCVTIPILFQLSKSRLK